jgi:hypothetical protein
LTPGAPLAAGAAYTATVKGGASGVKDLAGLALAADVTWSFTTSATGTPSCSGATSLWPANPTPAVPADPDTSAVELGVKFRSSEDGFVCGLRFYKGSGNTGTHVGHLWTSTGQLLATVTFTNETASGWQQMLFDAPVAITANTVYVASYHAPVGRYSVNENYFASGVASTPLYALSSSESGGNGVYLYGSGGFPTDTYQASNYWVDVLFATGATGGGTPPAAPSGLTGTAVSSTRIDLGWTDTAANESGFKIERCQGAGCSSFAEIATVGSNVASYADTTGLAASTSYSYRVRAYNSAGDSAYSNTASATTLGGPVNTGFLSPSANAPVTVSAGDKNGFETTPENAYVADGAFAVDANSGTGTGTSCTGSGKDKHLFYDYGFAVPAGAAIQGIEVQLTARVSSTASTPTMCVQLSWNGGASWTAAQRTATLSTASATYTLGGPGNTWGRTWAASDFSNANFRVRIIDVASSTARTFSLDSIAVRITYI